MDSSPVEKEKGGGERWLWVLVRAEVVRDGGDFLRFPPLPLRSKTCCDEAAVRMGPGCWRGAVVGGLSWRAGLPAAGSLQQVGDRECELGAGRQEGCVCVSMSVQPLSPARLRVLIVV